jgi:hypothetical protein
LAWRIEITNTAKKQLAKLDHQVKAEIVRYLRERISTEDDPRRYGAPLEVPRWRLSYHPRDSGRKDPGVGFDGRAQK